MAMTSNPPSISKTAFECPYCGAFTSQGWFTVYGDNISGEQRTPKLFDEEWKARIEDDKEIESDFKQKLFAHLEQMQSGVVLIESTRSSQYCSTVYNIYVSKCFNCNKASIWIYDKLIYPPTKLGATPNPDLPKDIISDFEEARSIVALSPRGAAALLRLVIQKLCVALGEKGQNLDTDIANLVSKGLNPLVQQSLDAVRVIGNEAVHPGTLDLKDDVPTALRLFDLINLIADQMITNPKNVRSIYDQLPESKRKAIEKRDKRTSG